MIAVVLFFLGAVVLTAYTYSRGTPMPRLNALGKVMFVLALGGAFLSMIGFAVGWAKAEGGGLLMLLSAAGFFVCFVASFKLHGIGR
jgi:hypothetical protein